MWVFDWNTQQYLDTDFDPVVLERKNNPGGYYSSNTREFFSLPYAQRVAVLKGEGVEAFADPGTLYLDEQYSTSAQDTGLGAKVASYAQRATQLPGEAVKAAQEAIEKTVTDIKQTVTGGSMPLWVKAALALSLVVGVAVVVKGAMK